MSNQPTPRVEQRDRKEAVAALEAQLRNTPRATKPYEYAAISYRLGLAHAESPVGGPQEGLRRALAYYDTAAAIFDPRYDPIEHARVLNAAGAAHRSLGDRRRAATLFQKAADLFEGKDRDGERAAALNNLGLVQSELGELAAAAEAFDVAADLFDVTTPDGRRGRVATLHNRGQAHAAAGTPEGLEAALADYEEARADLDPDDAPYHYGLVHHSVGVTCSALAAVHPDDRRQFLEEAVRAFDESLRIFARTDFPYQHALAKHNLGLVYAAMGGTTNLRRALVCFEDAVATLDTRLHADAWRQAYASLERAEKELAVDTPGLTRQDHFANLAADVKSGERAELVKERLVRLRTLPDQGRLPVAELALAVARLGEERARGVIADELSVVMEFPREMQELVLDAIWDAHRQLGPEEREAADRALDEAIGDALGGPQRIFVRDHLYGLGWERP
jgi:tetratricopeptide (TPR) repeat protein